MKNGMKLLVMGTAILTAAVGITAYRKYREDCCDIKVQEDGADEMLIDSDFESMETKEDDFIYYLKDTDQILFYE